MMEALDRMRNAVEDWLVRTGAWGDAVFYSRQDWMSKEGVEESDALLYLSVDGSALYTLLNFGGDTEEFDDLIESFGFWYEMGEAWYMAFYAAEDYDFRRIQGKYSEVLKDPRWVKKAQLVKNRAENRCQDCDTTARLDAHHCYYASMRLGYQPWEYPLSALRALCRPCHHKRERVEIQMRAFMSALTQAQMEALHEGLGSALYWFPADGINNLLANLRGGEAPALASLASLLRNRNETHVVECESRDADEVLSKIDALPEKSKGYGR